MKYTLHIKTYTYKYKRFLWLSYLAYILPHGLSSTYKKACACDCACRYKYHFATAAKG